MSASSAPGRRAAWARGDPIVVFGDDWGRFVSTMQHVFRHIALDHPVVWVNAIGHRLPTVSIGDARRVWEKVRAMARPRAAPPSFGLIGGGTPAAIIEPHVLPWHNIAAIHALNSALLVRSIRRRLALLGERRPPVVVTGSPPSVGVLGRLREVASVYFCMDDFLNLPGVSAKMIAPLEQQLLARVDAVVATAQALTQSKVPASGLAYYLPQGVNYEHFSTVRPEPSDLSVIPHPRIGFAGGLSECFDFSLVRRIAETYRDCSVVLIGPLTGDRAALHGFEQRNVYLMGPRPYEYLPAYVQHFDLGVIPYVLSDWTKAVDPLKLLEYLAAGLPVVSSALPEVAKYAGAISIASDEDAFIRAVGEALMMDRDAARERGQALARQQTWKHRADTLLTTISEVVERRPLPLGRGAAGRPPL